MKQDNNIDDTTIKRKVGRPKRTETQEEQQKKDFLRELEISGGSQGVALKNIGFSYTHLQSLLKNDNDFRLLVQELRNEEANMVEGELIKQIKAGNTTATIYYLNRKGSRIGYGPETNNTSLTINEPIKISYIVPIVEENTNDRYNDRYNIKIIDPNEN